MVKNNEKAVMGGSTESVDLAALLMALGFHCDEAKVIEGINVDNGRKQPSTMSWQFSPKSLDNKYDIDKVKRSWKLPKSFTLDAVPLSRLLAHNLAVLKSIAAKPRNVIFSDLGGIGMLSDNPQTENAKDLLIHNNGFGGECDTATCALAITLGVVPQSLYVERGRLSVVFLTVPSQVCLHDVKRMLRDPKMRDPENMHAVAILVCQCLNRQVILDNMHRMKRNRRLIADGGDTQILYNPDSVSEKDKDRIKRFLG